MLVKLHHHLCIHEVWGPPWRDKVDVRPELFFKLTPLLIFEKSKWQNDRQWPCFTISPKGCNQSYALPCCCHIVRSGILFTAFSCSKLGKKGSSMYQTLCVWCLYLSFFSIWLYLCIYIYSVCVCWGGGNPCSSQQFQFSCVLKRPKTGISRSLGGKQSDPQMTNGLSSVWACVLKRYFCMCKYIAVP